MELLFVTLYIGIGFISTYMRDLLILSAESKPKKGFPSGERIFCVFLWPLVLVMYLLVGTKRNG